MDDEVARFRGDTKGNWLTIVLTSLSSNQII